MIKSRTQNSITVHSGTTAVELQKGLPIRIQRVIIVARQRTQTDSLFTQSDSPRGSLKDPFKLKSLRNDKEIQPFRAKVKGKVRIDM
jgi:hypothetical protein